MSVKFQDSTGAEHAALRTGRLAATLVLKALRFSIYGLLALLRPIVIPILMWVAVGGVGIWAIFVLIAHDSEFPSLQVLGMSVGCALCCVLYYAVMELLVPESQRSDR